MTVTFIAAMSEDGILAQNGRIPWHLPDDVTHFRTYCAGRWLLVGRKTWEQMQGWFRPGQTPVVVTHNALLVVPGGYAVHSVEAGIALAKEHGATECVVIGGGEIFHAALPFADKLVLTVVHTTLGDGTRFPALDPQEWRVAARTPHPADASHAFAFTFEVWRRIPD